MSTPIWKNRCCRRRNLARLLEAKPETLCTPCNIQLNILLEAHITAVVTLPLTTDWNNES